MAYTHITSMQSPRIREVAKLHNRKWRTKLDRFIVEGPQAVREALRSHRDRPAGEAAVILDGFITDAAAVAHPDLEELAAEAEFQFRGIEPDVIELLGDTVNTQGVVVVARLPRMAAKDVFGDGSRLIIVLNEIRDPGNVGAILRVADAAGADALVITPNSVDVTNPKAVRAATGSHFHLPIVTELELERVAELGRASGLQILAADANGAEHDLHRPWESGLDLGTPTVWVFGNEAHGLSPQSRGLCDGVVAIPIYGKAESLNLATAAGVCAFESARNMRP